MKWITIQLMKYHLKVAFKEHYEAENPAVKKAYDMLMKNYIDTIMFLKATSKQ